MSLPSLEAKSRSLLSTSEPLPHKSPKFRLYWVAAASCVSYRPWRRRLGRLRCSRKSCCGWWDPRSSSNGDDVEFGRRSGVVSTTSKTTSIGGMVRLDLDNECVWMDERWAVALFGAMVASTAGLTNSMHQYLLIRWIGERLQRIPIYESASDRSVP